MSHVDPEVYGAPNPNAPKELSRFDFLVGAWRGQGKSHDEDGTSSSYQMKWTGRYILDGYAIADEARILDEKGQVKTLFVTYRMYDRDGKRWIIEAWNVLESTMVHGSPSPEEVQVDDSLIQLLVRWPNRPNAVGRETFTPRSKDYFTYCLDVSTDGGKTWMEAWDVIEAKRIAE